MSVDLSCLTVEVDTLRDYPDHCLVGFTSEEARNLAQGVARAPLANNPAHSAVFDRTGRRPKSVQRALAKLSVWIVHPN